MEVPEVEEGKKGGGATAQMTSAAAFVEGGIQDECEDACSICLEDFTSSDPSTLTKCRHEYHLQCILEWCQRSSECPMCLQPVSLKDPSSQELFAAVERERKIRAAASRNATIFRHPTLGDFELQHLPVGASDAELEERIIQHLAAAAAMGRGHFGGRRESHRSRSAAHRRPHYLVFSTHHNQNAPSGQVSSSMSRVARESEPAAINVATPSTPLTGLGDELPQQHASGSSNRAVTRGAASSNERTTTRQSSLPSQDSAGPSDLQSFSESLKSRLSAVSMRYRESFSRSTRGWKERFFSRSNSLTEIGSEVRREVNAGIASVSRIMERLDSRDSNGTANGSQSPSTAHTDNHRERENSHMNGSNSSSPAVAAAAASGST